ncbi:MAG: dITP/XTP pyrophosphatase [Anaerolineales bacterium]|nr:dITP/XTP pyrophosphatase [Anaerolineales bacterium]
MNKLLIATHNPGKLVEYRELLAGLPIELTSPAAEGLDLEVEETGDSFEENAVLKARAFKTASGLPALADDSGLEVMALDDAPGIHSSRYAGPNANDEERYRKLLKNLEGVPWARRHARFRCVIAIATPQGAPQTVEGQVTGRIAFEPRGEHGFGYDPVFYLPRHDKTMAELPEEIKNQISHRADAARKAIPVLQRMLNNGGREPFGNRSCRGLSGWPAEHH